MPVLPSIPYASLVADVLAENQALIPFLGAGASIAGAPPSSVPVPSYPPDSEIDELATRWGLSGAALDHLKQGIRQAFDLQNYENHEPEWMEIAGEKPYPPSARELANALAANVSYHGTWPYSLLPVSSYHEFVRGRDPHRKDLESLFAGKTQPLPSQDLIARAARHHLRHTKRDYLVITTNYDQLIELAFDAAKVPYMVLTVGRKQHHVTVRASASLQAWLGLSDEDFQDFLEGLKGKQPALFTLPAVAARKPVAVLYKMHGCLFPPAGTTDDSIILSDEDYIAFLKRQGESGDGVIPAAVTRLMQNEGQANTGFLFLGYSFSDWNVRAMYRTIIDQRALTKDVRDYAVVSWVNDFESQYLSQPTINVCVADLVKFSSEIKRRAAPEAWSDTPALW
ncbi:MAG: SIR2 family protein [Acidobacteria bacterium]|nr:SIR2 family protein [Acidobacteriota bacterium]